MDVFKRGEPVRGYQGGALPEIMVDVTGIELEGYSMRAVIEPRYTPGEAVMVKNCVSYSSEEGTGGFKLQLTSSDTQSLSGSYIIHFVLSDGANTEFRNLIVPLEILQSPEEGS